MLAGHCITVGGLNDIYFFLFPCSLSVIVCERRKATVMNGCVETLFSNFCLQLKQSFIHAGVFR